MNMKSAHAFDCTTHKPFIYGVMNSSVQRYALNKQLPVVKSQSISAAHLIQKLKAEIVQLKKKLKHVDILLVQKEIYANGLALDLEHAINHMEYLKKKSTSSNFLKRFFACFKRVLAV